MSSTDEQERGVSWTLAQRFSAYLGTGTNPSDIALLVRSFELSARERARIEWEMNVTDLSEAAAHPPVVLWVPRTAHGTCLQCTWIDRGGASIDGAASSTRGHSVQQGADPAVIAELPVPISEGIESSDDPLWRK